MVVPLGERACVVYPGILKSRPVLTTQLGTTPAFVLGLHKTKPGCSFVFVTSARPEHRLHTSTPSDLKYFG